MTKTSKTLTDILEDVYVSGEISGEDYISLSSKSREQTITEAIDGIEELINEVIGENEIELGDKNTEDVPRRVTRDVLREKQRNRLKALLGRKS